MDALIAAGQANLDNNPSSALSHLTTFLTAASSDPSLTPHIPSALLARSSAHLALSSPLLAAQDAHALVSSTPSWGGAYAARAAALSALPVADAPTSQLAALDSALAAALDANIAPTLPPVPDVDPSTHPFLAQIAEQQAQISAWLNVSANQASMASAAAKWGAGFASTSSSTSASSSSSTSSSTSSSSGGKRKRKEPRDFVQEQVMLVTHLPPSASESQIGEWAEKAGLILKDVTSGEPFVALIPGEHEASAGIVYFKPDSVVLALSLLHQTEFVPGSGQPVSLTPGRPALEALPADFIDAAANTIATVQKDIKSNDRKRGKRLGVRQTEALEWDAQDQEKHLARILVAKHVFSPINLLKDPKGVETVTARMTDIAESAQANLQSIKVFDLHPQGVVKLTCLSHQDAIALRRGIQHSSPGIHVSFWDGVDAFTDEDPEATKLRLARFGDWLENNPSTSTTTASTSTTATST